MAFFTFRGGIHPYDGKDLSKDKPIRDVLPKGNLVYPLLQNIGAPAKSIVASNDRVLVGQKIAEADGVVSVPVYSTVSGTVKVIEPRLTAAGDMVPAVVVENDNLYEEVPFKTTSDLENITGEQILKKIKAAGIVGMGGAGFPTHVKLSPKEPDKIDYVIVNCAECEPYLTSDYRRMLEEPEKVVKGLQIVLRLFRNAMGILAVEDNKKDCIELLKKYTKSIVNLKVVSLKTKYPQGAERQLIYAATGRAIHSEMLPLDAGCIVNNVDTVVAVYHGVMEGRPLMHRIVTVTGDAVTDPRNFKVLIGTNYQELIRAAGGFKRTPRKFISGGPMMGFGIYDLNIPVTKTSSALLCLTQDEVGKYEETACISCGKCVEICPGRILPARLADFAVQGNEESFLKYSGMECCECGCCSYTCPAKRPLTQAIKSMRRMVLEKRKKQVKKNRETRTERKIRQ